MIKISPSLLAADFSKLQDEVKKVENAGAEWLHLDVMDGMFVPNISFGPCVIASLRKHVNMFFDVHLMINEPIRYLNDYKDAGADGITVHFEACKNVKKTLSEIRALGLKSGLSIKPATPVSAILPYIGLCDIILIMTVEPGFGGQKLIPSAADKVKEVSSLCERLGISPEIEADGGITPENVKALAEKGLTVAVAGSAVFKAQNPEEAIRVMKNV